MKLIAAAEVLVAASDAEGGTKVNSVQTLLAFASTTVVVIESSGSEPVVHSEPIQITEGL